MAFIVYLLQCADGSLYTGSTSDLPARLRQHNYLKSGAKYTRQRRPVKLIYQEGCKTFNQARKREAAIKKLRRLKKLELIISRESSS